MEIPSLHRLISIACLPPPTSWAVVRNDGEIFFISAQKVHMQTVQSSVLTQVILGDVQWKLAPSLIPWSAPPLPKKRGVEHKVDRSIKPHAKSSSFPALLSLHYLLHITATVFDDLAKLQDHLPGQWG